MPKVMKLAVHSLSTDKRQAGNKGQWQKPNDPTCSLRIQACSREACTHLEKVLLDSVTPIDSRQPVAHHATMPVKDMQADRLQQRPQRSHKH